MLVLDATTKSITTKLGAVHTTNPVTYVYAYADQVDSTETFTEGGDVAQSNGTTSQAVIPAPAASTQRTVKDVMIYNSDTISHAVTLYYTVSGTDYPFYKETLAAGAWAYPLRDGVFEGSAAAAADMVLSEIQTVTGAKTFADGTLLLAGATSGTSTLKGYALGGVTLSLPAPAAPDTLVSNTNTATITNKTLTSPTITGATITTTSVKPVTNDGTSLGEASTAYSDLFLATGAQIDFGNNDVDLVHSTNMLTVSGGDFTAPNIIAETAVLPDANDGAALGTTALQFSDLFLAEGGVINFDNGDVTVTQSGNDLTIAGGSLTARVKPRTGGTTSSATPTINTDDVDYYELTAQTADITSFTTNLSGTPTKAQKLWIAITGTAARAITWGASFESSTVTLPTTTVTTNRLDVGFVWNDVTSKWRCVAKG